MNIQRPCSGYVRKAYANPPQISIWCSTYSLGQGTALADGNPVTLRDTESGGDVGGKVLVTLLVTEEKNELGFVLTKGRDRFTGCTWARSAGTHGG